MGVPVEYDFPAVAVTRLLDDAAAAFPTSPALDYTGTTTDYRDLRDLVNRRAAGLVSLGLRRGQRVVVLLPNCPAHVVAALAVLRAGAVLVEVDPLAPVERVAHVLRDCTPHIVICLDMTWETVEQARAGTSVEHVVVTSLADALPRGERVRARLPLGAARARSAELRVSVPTTVRRLEQVRADGTVRVDRELDPRRELALVHYSDAGSSPRGIRLTHAALVANAYQVRLWRVDAVPGREAVLAVLPLFNLFGLVAGLLSTLLLAGRVVLVPVADPEQVLVALRTTRPVFFPGVPALFRALLDAPEFDAGDLRSVRAAVSTAGRVSHPLRDRFRAEAGLALLDAYGPAEAGACTHCSPLGTAASRSGTVGLPLTGTAMRVVDLMEPSRPVPPGERGQLAVRGPQLFDGYWNGADATDVLTQDGYLLTGDLACMDSDGYLTVLDRLDDVRDPALPPSAVEAALQQVEGVRDAAVDAAGTAYVVRVDLDSAEPTEQQLRDRLREEFAEAGVPAEVVFVAALPRDRLGSVRREDLAESAAREDAEHGVVARREGIEGADSVERADDVERADEVARRDDVEVEVEVEATMPPPAADRREAAVARVEGAPVAPERLTRRRSVAVRGQDAAGAYGFVPDPQRPERLIPYELPREQAPAAPAPAAPGAGARTAQAAAWTRVLSGLVRRRSPRATAPAAAAGGPAATAPPDADDEAALVRVVRPDAEPPQESPAAGRAADAAQQPPTPPRHRSSAVDAAQTAAEGELDPSPVADPAVPKRRTPRPRTSTTAGKAGTSTAATPAAGTAPRRAATARSARSAGASGDGTAGSTADVTAETGAGQAPAATQPPRKAATKSPRSKTTRGTPLKAAAKAPAPKAAAAPTVKVAKATARKALTSAGTKAAGKASTASRARAATTARGTTPDPHAQGDVAQADQPSAPRELATARLRRGGSTSPPAGPAAAESPGQGEAE